jgi:hypothetical protein
VGCHQSLEGETGKDISVGSCVETGAGVGKSEAGLHPVRKEERRKTGRIILYNVMFELR